MSSSCPVDRQCALQSFTVFSWSAWSQESEALNIGLYKILIKLYIAGLFETWSTMRPRICGKFNCNFGGTARLFYFYEIELKYGVDGAAKLKILI